MAAIIRSFRNGIDQIDGASRDDYVAGDIALLSAVDAHSTYSWVIAFAPETSAATFSGDPATSSPGTITIDVEGPYLIKLVVDAGQGTESEQYVRLRALTAVLGLTLVAAGERRDTGGIIPVDVDVEGWANEQNANLLALEAAATVADDHTMPVTVFPGNDVEPLFWAPYDLIVTGIKVNAETTPVTAGVYTFAVVDDDASNNLLAAATADLTALAPATLTSLALTATTANLSLAKGTRIKFSFVSDNFDLAATGVYFQLLYRSQ